MTTALPVLVRVCALLATLATSFGQNSGIAGNWAGALQVGGAELRLVFKITANPDGSLAAKLDSPDQSVNDIPVHSITIVNGKVTADVTVIGGIYEGTMSTGGGEIVGTWKQRGQSFPLTLKRVDKVPEPKEFKRPQVPHKPYPYEEQEVTFDDKAAGVTLAGTLTFPKNGGPYPAVLLIAGSGPNKRDEEVYHHPVFMVLADYLTRRGFAVLRYDKRGVGKSTGSYANATTRDFADDALAGIAFLSSQKNIQPNQIGAIGHSEGGLIVPMLAAESGVKFIVMMAGPGIDGGRILELQTSAIGKASGASDKDIEEGRRRQEEIFSAIRESKSDEDMSMRLDKLVANAVSAMRPEERNNPDVKRQLEQTRVQLGTRWMRYFVTYDPVPALRQVRCPVLALNGEKDLQVPIDANLPIIEAALKAGGNKDYTIKRMPNLNHLFQTCKTGLPGEYGQIEETISPIALATIADWLAAHTRS